MSKGNGGITKAKYREMEPDVTGTGIGKCYKGFRIFHSRKKDAVEYIGNDYSLREPTTEELARFRKDLADAARRDRKVAGYLEEFPSLKIRAGMDEFKPEPETIGE
jgi:hypothetical protein